MGAKLPPSPSLSEGAKKRDYWADFYARNSWTPQAQRWAIVLAIIFHLFLFLIVLPPPPEKIYHTPGPLINLRPLATPPPAGPPKTKALPKTRPAFKPKAKVTLPFPDPTPDDPEPLISEATEVSPEIIRELDLPTDIGEVTGPTGGQETGQVPGTGEQKKGEIYTGGEPGLVPPIILDQPLPKYTEEARKKRLTGTVVLKVVINKLGRVEQVRVVKSLDPELDQSAIQTIINQWRFRPALLNGQPVSFEANIAVDFNLY